jgi:O-antigen/teichoic acid export membrane protein
LAHERSFGVDRIFIVASNSLGSSLARRVFRGSVWLFASYGLLKLSRMIIMLVIAALLSPEAYGVVSLCSVIIFVGETVGEFGIWQAVVNRKEPDEGFLNTAFTANVCGGVVVAAGLFLAAPWLALFYGFKVQSLPTVGSAFGAVVTTVTLLLLGFGVLSFAVGYLVETIIRLSLVMVIARWRPRFQIHRA